MTKKGFLLLSFVVFLLLVPVALNAQCKQFAKNTCKAGLKPYQHDGNYDAANIFVEGEEAELYKTFHSEIRYRIGVCSSGNLPDIEFKVVDPFDDEKVYYDNHQHDFDWKWDLILESSRQLKIMVKVPVSDNQEGLPEEGCVAVVIGSLDY